MSDFIVRAWSRIVTAATREDGQAVTEYAVVLVVIAAISTLLLASGTGIPSMLVTKISTAIGGIGG
jgi:hypothetical protein